MATVNYTDLQAQVVSYSMRSDVSSVVPDMVVLCEKKINRILRDMNMEATSTTSPLTETTALPSNCLEVKQISISWGGQRSVPTFITPDKMDAYRTVIPTPEGDPIFFTIRANNVEVYPKPTTGTTYTMTLTYLLRIVPLATTATNWLLTDHFDVYLYGTLCEIARRFKDDEMMARFKPDYEEAVAGLKALNARRRVVPHEMQMDAGLCGLNRRMGTPSIGNGFN
jgi:hypothetical protein